MQSELCEKHPDQRERRLNTVTREITGEKFFASEEGKANGGDLTIGEAYRKQIHELNPDLLLQGDYQGMLSKAVLAKTKTYIRNKEKLSDNVLIDLRLRNEKWEKEKPGTGIVSGIAIQPLNVTLLLPPAMSILRDQNKQAEKEDTLVSVHFDGTHHTQRVFDRSSMHHCIVMPVYPSRNDKVACLMSLFEIITDSSTTHSLECGLIKFRDQYRAFDSGKMFDIITSDKDLAGIGALMSCFNRMTTLTYLKESFDAFNDEEKANNFFQKNIVIALCSSHSAAAWLRALLKAYLKGQINAAQFKFLASVIGLIYEVRNKKDFDVYVEGLLTLLLAPYITPRVS
jgi:hypothetical protein